MNPDFLATASTAIGATKLTPGEKIQTLWSGYGDIVRYHAAGGVVPSVVVKHVKLPDQRGRDNEFSHMRKIHSYHVESEWYRNWSSQCDDNCRIPRAFATKDSDTEFLMVLEDLDAAGYSVRKSAVILNEMEACLAWLANFHATFLGKKPAGLWECGTYWHLQTRPQELEVLDDQRLKEAAVAIDSKLRQAKFQTIVHGDAKLANFCFAPDASRVAAVDFQYTGGGPGIKDVAYFIGSCLGEAECDTHETGLLDFYFAALQQACANREYPFPFSFAELEAQWRKLFYWAWADFHRFLKGWSPGHWKINSYSEKITRQVLNEISATS